MCLGVCRGCCGCHVEDSHAVRGGISAGVSAEKVEWGTEGGECFLCITYNNPVWGIKTSIWFSWISRGFLHCLSSLLSLSLVM